MKRTNLAPFSIIICAHNELKNLKKNLPHLVKQTYANFEILVVLDRCDDGSFEMLEQFFHKDERIRVLSINKVPEGFHPKKYGLTKAIEFAYNEWVLLTDADCRPTSKYWIQTFNNQISPETSIILGTSPYIPNPSLLSQFVDYETLNTALLYISEALVKKPYMGVGRNVAYRRSLFISAEGFGEYKHITGGDDDLFIQKNASITNTATNIAEEGQTISSPPVTWKKWLSQKTRHLSVGKHYSQQVKMRLFWKTLPHQTTWVSFIILLSFNPKDWIVILAMLLGLGIKGRISKFAASSLNMKWNSIVFPILDFAYAIFIPLIGLRSLMIKNIRWS